MQIISPTYILTPTKLLEGHSVAFQEQIVKIAPTEELLESFPEASHIQLQEHSLLMPGLINTHVHLEFSANKTTLSYGDFMTWLYSVIEHRETLINDCSSDCITEVIDGMLSNGITTFGAVSSHGMDLEACQNAKQNIVFFNELIGSQAAMADVLFGDFISRLETSKDTKRKGFFPAIAIHSPYSVHPILIKRAVTIAKEQNLKLTAHFLESKAESEWLKSNSGDFLDFFSKLLKQTYSVSDIDEFLSHFKDTPTLFTHATKATTKELETIAEGNHTIIHCPISNRLLGNGVLDISILKKLGIPFVTATDGLSSNYTLNLFEELKIALFIHSHLPAQELAQELLESVTCQAAKALGLNTGAIEEGKNADMLVIDLDGTPNEQLALHLILHRYNISKIFINGALVKEQ
ncbi:MAG: metal-dependent hydrolase [Sulfurimonadaceae bacterium]|jgi:cytosine/adenosine deaminase-related metal-dependent hydrolase|nr:metal-dependent hydrolase [Sulfurimonadaceae bacterium]